MIHRQKAMTREAVGRLQGDVFRNLNRYEDAESWVGDYADDMQWEFATPCEVATSLDLMLPEPDDRHDLVNAIRLFKAFPKLTPVQARDPRLWTHLTHVELWDYMRQRWPVERFSQDRGKAERFVLARYFVAQNQSRTLLRNGAARLWWSANLTYDSSRSNPFELTAVLLERLDIAQQLLERNLGRIGVLTRTFLDFLLAHKEQCLVKGESARRIIRQLAQGLNVHGGVCLLDCMKPKEIVSVLDAELARATEGNVAADDEKE